MKKVLFILLIIIIMFSLIVLTGCNENNTNSTSSNKMSNTTNKKQNTTTSENKTESPLDKIDFVNAAEEQVAMPNVGDTIAIIHVRDYGDITVKFFEDKAPKAVENFVEHSKEGYYDGVKFHRVIDEFMIQGGDPLGNGTGGESIWGKGFEEELDYKLVPYRGSLCMASAGTGTSSLGSQFFITQANYSETMENALKKAGYPDGLVESYKKYGGYMSLYLYYTVFGQVIDGMDVVDQIAKVEVEAKAGRSEKSSPVEDVIIDTIEITTYEAK